MEEALSGGNTHEAIVRINDTVHRPTGPWTPGVHAVLTHLERLGFDGAPRVRGIDEQGREVLDYIEGEVVHPDHDGLLVSDAALAEVVASIRRFHDAVESFIDSGRFAWSDRGGDPSGPHEILCHNDLAPWNLIHGRDGRWAFIDWDLAAPGRRSWDLAWALLSMVPLMPGSDLSDQRRVERTALFRHAYGRNKFPDDALAVAVERCAREADLIDRLGAAGEPPYERLLKEGHGEIWHAAAAHILAHASDWQSALNDLG
jgi:phosphotransferase family enzyme